MDRLSARDQEAGPGRAARCALGPTPIPASLAATPVGVAHAPVSAHDRVAVRTPADAPSALRRAQGSELGARSRAPAARGAASLRTRFARIDEGAGLEPALQDLP